MDIEILMLSNFHMLKDTFIYIFEPFKNVETFVSL